MDAATGTGVELLRPPDFARMIRIFRFPRTTAAASLQERDARFADIHWHHARGRPLDEDVELGFARSAASYREGLYADALDELEFLEGFVDAGRVNRYELSRSRAEVLIVMGKCSDAIPLLEAYVEPPLHSVHQLERCWLFAAQLELGDHVGAERSREALRADDFLRTEPERIALLQAAWFCAFVGEFGEAELQFSRWSRAASADNEHPHLRGFLKTAGYLAQTGSRPEAGAAWASEIERQFFPLDAVRGQ